MTRTQWMVVGGLMIFILVVFGILLFKLRVPESSSTVSPPPAFLLEEQAQARTAFPVAQQEAQRWQQDAQLAAVGIVLDDLGPGGVLKRDRWTFQFYSPSKQQMAVIRVSDGEAQQLRTGLLPNRLPVLSLDQWQVDSGQALQTWWTQGGGSFVQGHPHVSISLKLRPEPGGTRPVWTVAGSASDRHWTVQLDSGDGKVVQ
jgi:hypothetical protein